MQQAARNGDAALAGGTATDRMEQAPPILAEGASSRGQGVFFPGDKWRRELRDSDTDPRVKELLRVMADFHDPKTGQMFPSIERLQLEIVTDAGRPVSKSSIIRRRREAIGGGWIVPVSRGHRGKASVYRLSFPDDRKGVSDLQASRVNQAIERVSAPVRKRVSATDTPSAVEVQSSNAYRKGSLDEERFAIGRPRLEDVPVKASTIDHRAADATSGTSGLSPREIELATTCRCGAKGTVVMGNNDLYCDRCAPCPGCYEHGLDCPTHAEQGAKVKTGFGDHRVDFPAAADDDIPF